MPMISWNNIYPEIQRYGRVFSYNRHGIGKTSKAPCPRADEEIIKSLERVLRALSLPPPYVLVAHPLRGILVNLQARTRPTDVSAVVTDGKKMLFAPQASFKAHFQCQKELIGLSPNSVQIIAENSGHFPQITEPQTVIQAITKIVSNLHSSPQ
jgi:pimeloyl-ACP methyl ester carboxylesterase